MMKGREAKRLFGVRLSGRGGPLAMDCNGLILCFGEDESARGRLRRGSTAC